MSEGAFVPARLRLARDLGGWTQIDLAHLAGLTPAALSQFESGAARPAPSTRKRLSEVLEVPLGFFELPLLDTHDGFFRSLRRTPVAERRRARAYAHIAHDLATCGDAIDRFPPPALPTSFVGVGSDVHRIDWAAQSVRADWQLPSGPVTNVVEILESHGIVVMRLPLGSADVDAFSLPFRDRPIVVLGADKNDRARSRFDAAHELGHLVMHGEQLWGLPDVERQAHRFAAAFLMPEQDIAHELPDRIDWPRLFELKRKWHVSLAALLMRARTLGRITDSDYLTAVKVASIRGWRRTEPIPLGRPEQPRLLMRLMGSAGSGDCRKRLPRLVVDQLEQALAG
jgi:Zn-dependent peptidase ImmA (M78 family)/transcriptional regulator with XRE-family HTH domain